MEIGIIGFGNFGKFMAKHLKTKAEVFVFDILDREKEAKALGISLVSFDEAVSKGIVIICVPMQDFESVLDKMKDKLRPGSLVLDVCSLKMFSCRLMEKVLPRTVDIIGTHPLFGPQSAPSSLTSMRIALTPIRGLRIEKVKLFCESLGLEVFITTPEEHDKQMALSQALTHFIGQAMTNAGIKRIDLSTKTFDNLMDIVEIIRNDTPALFNDMQKLNPFAKDARENFLLELNKIQDNLK